MPEFSLGLVVEGVDLTDDDVVNSLYEAGLDDASFAVRDGSHVVYLEIDGQDFASAVWSGVRRLESASPTLRVVGLQGDQLLTQSGVAEVAQRTRQSVHQHVHGSRGSGFPTPVLWADATRPLWLRGDVLRWSDQVEGRVDWFFAEESVLGAFILGRCATTGYRSAIVGLGFAVDRILALAPDAAALRPTLAAHLRDLADRIEAGEALPDATWVTAVDQR
jgi:hypothetical protein